MTGHLAWAVFVERSHENRWRDTLGQVDIEAWCRAHGWDAKDVLSGSVNVYGYRDGHGEVAALLIARDPDGKPIWDREANDIRRRHVTAPLTRSLPEGIGIVMRL